MCDCDCELPKTERWRQIREEALAREGVVAVPAEGSWLVLDGVPVQVHTVRKEADFMLNRCEPGDICGAQDGCNEV